MKKIQSPNQLYLSCRPFIYSVLLVVAALLYVGFDGNLQTGK